jgi:hypothetical protein
MSRPGLVGGAGARELRRGASWSLVGGVDMGGEGAEGARPRLRRGRFGGRGSTLMASPPRALSASLAGSSARTSAPLPVAVFQAALGCSTESCTSWSV